MTGDHAVQLRAGNVLAPPANDVLLARDEIEVSVVVLAREIAREEPAIAKRRTRLLRIVEVLAENDRRLHDELARLADGQVTPFVIDDAQLGEVRAVTGMHRRQADRT